MAVDEFGEYGDEIIALIAAICVSRVARRPLAVSCPMTVTLADSSAVYIPNTLVCGRHLAHVTSARVCVCVIS